MSADPRMRAMLLNNQSPLPNMFQPDMRFSSPTSTNEYNDSEYNTSPPSGFSPDGTMSGKKKSKEPKERHKVTKACVCCQKSHVSCDNARPCKRCVDKGIADKCADSTAKKRGRKKKYTNEEQRPPRKKKSSKSDPNSKDKDEEENEGNGINGSVSGLDNYNARSSLPMNKTNTNGNPNGGVMNPLRTIPSNENIDLMEFLKSDELLDLPLDTFSELLFYPIDNTTDIPSSSPSPLPHSPADGLLSPISSVSSPLTNSPGSASPLSFLPSPSNPSMSTNATDRRSATIVHSSLAGGGIYSSGESECIKELDKNDESIFSNINFFNRLYELLKSRVFRSHGEVEDFYAMIIKNRQRIIELRKNITADHLAVMKRDFTLYLNMFRNGFDQVGVPTVIWERCGIIHYVNRSFINLTHFNMKLPTEIYSFALIYMFSPNTTFHYTKAMKNCFLNLNYNSVMIPCGLRVWKNSPGEVYVEGTLCITIKRDILGLPMLFLGHFLPSTSALEGLQKAF